MLALEPLKLIHALMALDWRAQQPKCLRTRRALTEIEQAAWWRATGHRWSVILDGREPIGYTGVQMRGDMPELSFLLKESAWSSWNDAFDLVLSTVLGSGRYRFVTAEVYRDAETYGYWLAAVARHGAQSLWLPDRKQAGEEVHSLFIVFAQ